MMEIPQKSRLNEVLDILKIKKATIYPWLQTTGIKSHRDTQSGMVYFDQQQVMDLLSFQSYLKNGGVMKNWQDEKVAVEVSIPDVTSIEGTELEEIEELEIELEETELEEIEEFEGETTGEMVVAENETIQLEELPPPPPEVEINRHAELILNAQRQAAGVIIAQNILASQFIDRPSTLPPEIQKIINDSAPIPKAIDPLQYAKTLILSHNTGQHQAA